MWVSNNERKKEVYLRFRLIYAVVFASKNLNLELKSELRMNKSRQ